MNGAEVRLQGFNHRSVSNVLRRWPRSKARGSEVCVHVIRKENRVVMQCIRSLFIWLVWEMRCTDYVSKISVELSFHMIFTVSQSVNISVFCFKVRTHFQFSSCLGVFLGDIVDHWVKDLRYSVTQSPVQLTCTSVTHHRCNGTCMKGDNWQQC
jgi:hypothetical protein